MRTLVLHGGALGDCALTLHLIAALRVAQPAVRVTLAARSPLAQWAAQRGLIDAALSLESLALHPLYAEAEATDARSLTVVSLLGATRAFLADFELVISLLGGPEEAIAHNLQRVCPGRVLAVDPRPTAQTLAQGVHITNQWGQALRAQGVTIAAEIAETPARQARLSRPARAGADAGQAPTVICHPGSGSLAKCCALEAWEALVTQLRATGARVEWMAGPAELERFGDAYVERLVRSAPVQVPTSVTEAACLVELAEYFIGHDAGMTHVAGIAGARVAAVFGPTDPRVWRPLGQACLVVGFPPSDDQVEAWSSQLTRWLTDPDQPQRPGTEAQPRPTS